MIQRKSIILFLNTMTHALKNGMILDHLLFDFESLSTILS